MSAQQESGRRLTMAITELDIGGAEKAFVRIALGLKQLKWDVRVVSLRDPGPLADSLKAADIPVTALRAGGFLDLRAVSRLKKVLKEQQPDVLLTFLHQANIAGRLAARWAGVPVVVSGVRVADRRLAVTISERLTRRLVDRYIAVSEAVGQVHRKLCRIPEELMTVIPNGVDVDLIDRAPTADRSTVQCNPDDKIILSVGRLTAQKAPHDLLSAFIELRENSVVPSDRLKLIFAGEGPERTTLEERIASYGLQKNVQILGWRPDVVSLMKACDILVLSSHWEGLPNAVLEAMAASRPVVAANVDGCIELIDDGRYGWLFESGHPAHLASVLSEVLRNPEEAARRATAAQHLVEKRYRWENAVMSFHETLLQAMHSSD